MNVGNTKTPCSWSMKIEDMPLYEKLSKHLILYNFLITYQFIQFGANFKIPVTPSQPLTLGC